MCSVFYLPVFVPALSLDCRAMVFGKRWLHQYQLRRLLTPGYSGFCSTVHAGFTPGLSGSSIFSLSCLFQSPLDLILRPFPPLSRVVISSSLLLSLKMLFCFERLFLRFFFAEGGALPCFFSSEKVGGSSS
ncbi:hypothetical protein F2Q70_00014122 [Brassica cretica]|uniref:Uncharacterized protein n=1 Tax=Brassica cretica TaxID=69181 RepID=A0A8S9I2P0_BRACR|nr:hypothetical protein F2Q70_00014122 [Brassica cretica]